MEILHMAEETMQVRLKATPQADAITIKKSKYDPKLHTAVNPKDVPQQFRKTA
jgi:hypothetical protein